MDNGIERGAEALDKQIKSGKNPRKQKLKLVSDGGERFNATGRRVIRHDQGCLPEVLDQAGVALAEYGGNVYVYAGSLVRLYPSAESSAGGVHRPRGAPILHALNAAHLGELFGRAAAHERFDARSGMYKVCDCPKRVADSYLARGNWPELPTLAGFTDAPIVTLEGRLIDQHGYDAPAHLFQASDNISGYTSPPTAPSREDAKGGMEVLLNLIKDFPFISYEDRAAMLAGILTGLLRRVLPAAPLFAITAPTAGTGKTLLANSIAVIATGRRSSVLSLGHDEAETEKRLGGVLMAGDACIVLDNIERSLKGDLLCQVTTQPFVRLRPLGASAMVSVPTHSTIVATGNNLSPVGDLKRRVVMIRVDANQERPEQRRFARDHLEDVFSRRGELIRAALTIPLAYLAAGAPAIDGLHPQGGFEQWDRMVRRPLVWLGLPDPLKTSEGLRDQDPDIEGMRLLIGAWQAVFKDKATTVAEVVAVGMDAERKHHELYDALQLICREKPNSIRLGYWLRSHRDRIVDGIQIKQAGRDEHTKSARWQVIKCG